MTASHLSHRLKNTRALAPYLEMAKRHSLPEIVLQEEELRTMKTCTRRNLPKRFLAPLSRDPTTSKPPSFVIAFVYWIIRKAAKIMHSVMFYLSQKELQDMLGNVYFKKDWSISSFSVRFFFHSQQPRKGTAINNSIARSQRSHYPSWLFLTKARETE